MKSQHFKLMPKTIPKHVSHIYFRNTKKPLKINGSKIPKSPKKKRKILIGPNIVLHLQFEKK